MQRSTSTSSLTSSSSSSEPITYDLFDDASLEEFPRDTRKAKDWRPKSTWWKKSRWDMTLAEKLCRAGQHTPSVYTIKPMSLNRGPVPVKSVLEDNLWVLSRATAPILIQAAISYYYDYQFPIHVAYPLYLVHFIIYLKLSIHRMDGFMVKWGTIREKHIGRDRTPDNSVNSLAIGILSFLVLRTAIIFSAYDSTDSVLGSFTWSFPLKLWTFQLVLDYTFYCYHRATHEFPSLWKIHQKHHSTKNPTPILSILAGEYQEVIEVFLLPALCKIVVPMNFHEYYLTMCYIVYIEMLGHSGIRAKWLTPALAPILGPFGLCGEILDHENHHNDGIAGKNFGKQSSIFDALFGTRTERLPIE